MDEVATDLRSGAVDEVKANAGIIERLRKERLMQLACVTKFLTQQTESIASEACFEFVLVPAQAVVTHEKSRAEQDGREDHIDANTNPTTFDGGDRRAHSNPCEEKRPDWAKRFARTPRKKEARAEMPEADREQGKHPRIAIHQQRA